MIRPCTDSDFEQTYEIINDAAHAYKGIIPADRWYEPYMSRHYLQHEIEAGVVFYGYEDQGRLIGVMGIQDVLDVTLLRHAYVRTAARGKGIGSRLMSHVKDLIARPSLVGTWAAASWAISFYEKHGYRLVSREEKELLLRKYWSIPDRQVETSVVLADEKWLTMRAVR
ncbi:MAG: GNAT family N-acetyltransferase [Nitrospirae bacterium GWD2_57_9]|nr:MAG: GNAT family N-acetyltransferase [Nitrospirae bacterium GWD2_57_9]OGW46031.1 MAG: GNAT family N-acetyltransferase [Nitrospirae bacterium GWC2_57_9]